MHGLFLAIVDLVMAHSGDYEDLDLIISKIYGADICRDGGSYSLSFEVADGNWYEFFVQVKGIECNDYFPPKLYKGGVNGGEEVEAFTWASAGKFLSKIRYSSSRFSELVQLVSNSGVIT